MNIQIAEHVPASLIVPSGSKSRQVSTDSHSAGGSSGARLTAAWSRTAMFYTPAGLSPGTRPADLETGFTAASQRV